ncbi:hypothetical protein EV207_1284 [Scopulibacillus darangshiensis]|uniref:Uncharacterized protein n=1 Tax=Scopulibacillus darangshiensis TaxID=442528 RepID=A0A4R2NQP7_9BACL|nr:hypothetical protein [Scopulibacillus darangshiensis]TCP23781.1 hypothetical protein EV207_1284 [Scopulibacillus darangshiensis]
MVLKRVFLTSVLGLGLVGAAAFSFNSGDFSAEHGSVRTHDLQLAEHGSVRTSDQKLAEHGSVRSPGKFLAEHGSVRTAKESEV